MKNKNVKQETGLTTQIEEPSPVLATNPFELFPSFTPFSMMRRFTDDMEQFFQDFNGFALTPMFEDAFRLPKMKKFQKTMWSPHIEVSQNGAEFIVKADLPGLKKDDVDIEFSEGSLVISGERNMESNKEEEGYFKSERCYGSFCRTIALPEGFDAEKANATFEHGVLEITVPVPQKEPNVRKLPISEKAEKIQAKAA